MFKSILLTLLISLSVHCKEILLTPSNSLVINTAISFGSMTAATHKIMKLDAARKDKSKPIYIVLDSPGGEIMSGNDFIDFTVAHIENVHTITITAASMAHAIAQAIPGKRYITKSGIMMAHRAKGGFSGQFNDGEVETRLRLMKLYVDVMERRNAKRIGVDYEEYKAKVKDEWWEVGESAVTANHADEVVSLRCSPALLKIKNKVIIRSAFFQREVILSACPLLKVPLTK